jgi:hypothetical protein
LCQAHAVVGHRERRRAGRAEAEGMGGQRHVRATHKVWRGRGCVALWWYG